MNNTKNLDNSFQLLKISEKLETITDAKGGLIAAAIQTGLRNRNIKGVVNMILSMATDNEKMILDIIGKELLHDIQNVKL